MDLDPPSGASHELTRDSEKRNDWCKLSGLGGAVTGSTTTPKPVRHLFEVTERGFGESVVAIFVQDAADPAGERHRKPKMTPAKLRLAQAAMGQPETKVSALCAELGVTRQTLYRHVDAKGQLRPDGLKLLGGQTA